MAFGSIKGWLSIAAVLVLYVPVHPVEEANQPVGGIEGSLRGSLNGGADIGPDPRGHCPSDRGEPFPARQCAERSVRIEAGALPRT